MKRHHTAKALLACCASLFALAGVPTAATASITFMQFGQASPSDTIFAYTNLGGPLSASLTGAGSVVLLPDFGGLVLPSLAAMTFNATAAAPLQPNGTQLFSGTIVFTLNAPQMGLSGLSTHALTVNFTNATFTPDHDAADLVADDDTGATIHYSSDFQYFNGVHKNFAFGFSGATPPLTVVAGLLPDSQFSGAGTFATVPEPASWALMIGGFAAVGASMRTRRRMVAFA
jgi:hypothetical protein